jgi:hypothetical protein
MYEDVFAAARDAGASEEAAQAAAQAATSSPPASWTEKVPHNATPRV